LNRVHADLVDLGLPGLAGCPLIEDGRFGERMERAVRSFQEMALTDPADWNGIIGAKTWAQLELLTGRSQRTPDVFARDTQIQTRVRPLRRGAALTEDYETLTEQQPAPSPVPGSACAYFFKGSDYVRYDIANDSVDFGPSPIAQFWPALPAAFTSNLDAAVN